MTPTPQHLHKRGFQALVAPTQWQELLRQGRAKSFPPGERLVEQGARSQAVFALRQGRVRVVYTDAEGNEVVVAIRGPGDLIGEYAQRDRGVHMASVWTLEDCTASALTAAAFEGFIRRNHLGDPLQHHILGKARQVGERLWRATNLPPEQRMALLFLETAAAAPDSRPPTIPMTQQQVATSLGIARSSVTNTLARWREAGLIETRSGRMILLDLAALSRRANRS